jgi:MYXO-CTERM domain-containing protein
MVKRAATLGAFVTCFLLASSANASPPSGAHPRIFLTPTTKAAMKTKSADSSSQAARVIARCDDVGNRPGEYTSAVYQGEVWAYAAASCGLAWQLTGNASHAAAGLRMLNALLDDYNNVGDGGGGDDVVRHDTGYAMRFFAPYSALAYDWLHDAPGVASVLPHARARFKAWVDWYTASGYLNDVAGSNYQAGYVFAKTMIAIAEGGEDGATSDAYWSDVTGTLFTQVLVGNGLKEGGAMQGGDWAEGWQYAPLSVLEYSLSARAVEEQGFALPAMHQWASDLTVRFAHGLAPDRKTAFAGGDNDSTGPNVAASPRTLLATIAGVGSDQAAGWAAHLKKTVASGNDDCPVFDALAEARGVTPVDYTTTAPNSYLAKGTRNLYARSGWATTASWAVFTSAPKLVPDHQHVDASNFVLSHGADDLIVDPSPYGTRSSLTSNAVTAESNVVGGSYAPSQTPWSTATMSYARSTESGVVAARSDFSGAFRFQNTPSDVPFAQRNWVFLPGGEVVTIDRVRTDDPSRAMLVRFKTLANVSLSGNVARGTIGGSDVAIHAVLLSAGSPSIKQPAVSSSCDAQGSCNVGRFATTEYSVRVDGPSSLAVHVIDALTTGEAAADVASMSDPTIAATPTQNAAVVGTMVRRGTDVSYVLGSSAKDGVCTSLAYGVPGKSASHHVVFDAPADSTGKSSVTTKVEADRCTISITPGGAGAFAGSPLIFSLSSAKDGCAVNEDKTPPPGAGGGTPPTGGSSGGVPQSATMDDPGGSVPNLGGNAPAGGSAGCACRATPAAPSAPLTGAAFAGLALVIGLRRRARKTSSN